MTWDIDALVKKEEEAHDMTCTCIGSWDKINRLKSIMGIGVELREKLGEQKGDTRLLWQIRQRRNEITSTNT